MTWFGWYLWVGLLFAVGYHLYTDHRVRTTDLKHIGEPLRTQVLSVYKYGENGPALALLTVFLMFVWPGFLVYVLCGR